VKNPLFQMQFLFFTYFYKLNIRIHEGCIPEYCPRPQHYHRPRDSQSTSTSEVGFVKTVGRHYNRAFLLAQWNTSGYVFILLMYTETKPIWGMASNMFHWIISYIFYNLHNCIIIDFFLSPFNIIVLLFKSNILFYEILSCFLQKWLTCTSVLIRALTLPKSN